MEQPEAAKKRIGYLPEQPPLYPNETPQEYLTFVGEAKGLRGKELREKIDSAVQSAGIPPALWGAANVPRPFLRVYSNSIN